MKQILMKERFQPSLYASKNFKNVSSKIAVQAPAPAKSKFDRI